MRLYFQVILVCAGLVFLVNCGGGGSSGGGDLTLADLQGTWFGNFETDFGDPSGDYTITFDSNGGITNILIDGVPNPSRRGTFVQVGSNLFNGNSGTDLVTLMVDESAHYLLYIWEGGEFGVLEKGALSNPAYTIDDLLGSWSGFAYDYSSSAAEFLKETPFTATVTPGAALSLNGTDEDLDPFAGFFDTFNLPYGMYQGTITGTGTLDLVGYLSPNRQFYGAYVGDLVSDTWPTDFEFLLYTKQP